MIHFNIKWFNVYKGKQKDNRIYIGTGHIQMNFLQMKTYQQKRLFDIHEIFLFLGPISLITITKMFNVNYKLYIDKQDIIKLNSYELKNRFMHNYNTYLKKTKDYNDAMEFIKKFNK